MKQAPLQEGFSDCFYSEAYIVVWFTQEEFSKLPSTELIECDIFIADTVLQIKSVPKHQISAANLFANCVQFLTDRTDGKNN